MKKQSQIVLNKRMYPLYVGGSASGAFQDWDGKGSSVMLEARIFSEEYDSSDLVWSIENTDIASFDSENREVPEREDRRRVRARRTGVTTVTAELPDGACAQCILTVIDNYSRLTVSEIALNTYRLILQPGRSAQLIPILYPKDIYQNGMLDTSLIWESNDPGIIQVTDGNVTAVGIGETDIVVRSTDVNRSVSCHVTVVEAEGEEEVDQEEPEKIRQMQVGEKMQLPDRKGVIWQSDNRYIADVDENGLVTAGAVSVRQEVDETGMNVREVPDVVWIYATDIRGGRTAKYPVRVDPVPLPIYEISVYPKELSIPEGESRNVTAAVNTSVSCGDSVIWESSREDVVMAVRTEDSVYGTAQAVVTAKGPGEAVVTARIGDQTASCKIRIISPHIGSPESAAIHMEEKIEIDVDQVFQFKPRLTGHVANKKLHWIGTDLATATVDREGNVQGYRPGTENIYAVADDSLTAEQKIAVKNLCDNRKEPLDCDEIRKLLEGSVYAECELRVREGSLVLRNLHEVKEARTDHSVLLLWNRASLLDTGTFDHYTISCNGVTIAETRKLGYRAENLSPSSSYQFLVTAVDREGTALFQSAVTAVTKPKSKVINVLDYGASGDGRRMDTFFIQKAIADCPKGGTVWLPGSHVFVSGALFLKSDMTFQVDGVLWGSSNPKDYPRIVTRWEGWRKLEQSPENWTNSTEKLPANHCPHASLLNAGCYEEGENGVTGPYNVENLVISGSGQINSNGFILAYNEGANINTVKVASADYPVKDATSRGSAIRIHNGRNIYMKDIQVAYAPGWTIHTIYCDTITFDGMEVVSQGDGDCGLGSDIFHCGHIFNGDGIDPESCTHVNLFDILFTTGDDAVAIKSGRNKEGYEIDKPNAYIRITDCASKWSLGGFGTGSENSSGSHDLLFQNLEVEDVLISGIWLKTCTPRGGITENIQVRDLTAGGCNSPVWIFNHYSGARIHPNPAPNPPVIRRLTFENVHGKESNEMGFRLEGTSECMIQDVQFRGVSSGGRENRISFCQNISIK